MSDLAQLFASSLPIEVKAPKQKSAFLLIVFVAITVFLVWTLVHGQAQSVWIVRLCAVGSSLGIVVFVYALCEKRPLVLLDQSGVTVRGWRGCPVAWIEIDRVWKHVQVIRLWYGAATVEKRVDYVCLALKHSEQWRDSQGRIKRKFASYYHTRGWGDLYFLAQGMNFEADELVVAIQSHIGGVRLSVPRSLVPHVATSDA